MVVAFAPDHDSVFYADTLAFRVDNEMDDHMLELRGRGRAASLFITGGNPPPRPSERMSSGIVPAGLPPQPLFTDGASMAGRLRSFFAEL